ncbi:uncharacterized protein LOC122386323 [Amphibalanus amphitrite]|uniref:uncharacterized protein LOC122386323 n=1 Tax=Amphibalanus amphitrite TaxID=1232801 RepID=UPI001C90B7E9|nr:uncharacterized protein LOC122386323 [Amphibalanus amphitrite]
MAAQAPPGAAAAASGVSEAMEALSLDDNTVAVGTVNLLDRLPAELLTMVVKRLDEFSAISLACVSTRCRNAVELQLGRCRRLYIDGFKHWDAIDSDVLSSLLSRMTGLRELRVSVSSHTRARASLMETVAVASGHWTAMEELDLDYMDVPMIPEWIQRICTNCSRVTGVRMGLCIGDRCVQAVVSSLPGLRELNVRAGSCMDPGFGFGEYRRYRSPNQLLSAMARCTQLESLELSHGVPLSHFLPRSGLPALRELSVVFSDISDEDMALVISHRGLESLSLVRSGPSKRGMAMLSGLPALKELNIFTPDHVVCDGVLDRLGSAPALKSLRLGDHYDRPRVTAEGLVRLVRNCRTLTKLTLDYRDTEETFACGPDVEEPELLKKLRAYLAR